MKQYTNTNVIGNCCLLGGFTVAYKFCQGFKDAAMGYTAKIELNKKKFSAQKFKNSLISTALVACDPETFLLKQTFDDAAYRGYNNGVSFYRYLKKPFKSLTKC